MAARAWREREVGLLSMGTKSQLSKMKLQRRLYRTVPTVNCKGHLKIQARPHVKCSYHNKIEINLKANSRGKG